MVVHTCHAFGCQVARSPGSSRLRLPTSSLKAQVFTLLERYAGRLSDRIITVCDENKKQAIEQRLAAPQNIVTIYSGIDLSHFEIQVERQQVCQELQLDPQRPHVGFVGRLAEQKAPLDFVAAAKQVLVQRPDAQFVMAGDGPLVDQVRPRDR